MSAQAVVQPAADPGAVLAFCGVSVRAPDRRDARLLLRDVDWAVQPGEHWAVLGANGAGKTTLLRTAAGRVRPSAGTVRVLGENHGAPGLRDPALRMAQLEAAPRVMATRLTAVDLVVLRPSGPVAVRGERIPDAVVDQARELLARFGCAGLADRPYTDCSQGERQRILLARALMRDPELVLFDEPATALDLPGREGLLQAMDRLAADRPGLATVTVTHHPEELAASTTHALLLRDGEVIAAGPIATVLTGPLMSAAFGIDVQVSRVGDRWSTHAGRPDC
jgi:iron complex transport system ATP-binding protein